MSAAALKIVVIGGGPGGLYFALLTKKRAPDATIDVYEQNRADDTFGFGVVFSDETLDEFLSVDPQSYEAVRARFAYWSDIVIERTGERTVIGGNGFAGCSRKALLELLHQRCRALGINLHFSETVDENDYEGRFADADLIVVAQGVNSPIRSRLASKFGARTVETRNKFVWLGSTRPLDAFTFFFRQTEHGPFCAHTYQYEEGASTWVVETTPECWSAHGFSEMSEGESARCLEKIFIDELMGHRFLTNRSIWRRFPTVACAKWSSGKTILLGDAKATAHWSIGSGTKLAMECAIALSDAVAMHGRNLEAVASQYEKIRRAPVEITQHTAQVSLRWFEDMGTHLAKERYQFAFSLMSRGKSVTWDNIKLRDARFLECVEKEFYANYEKRSGRVVAEARPTPMFTPFDLRGLKISNRVVVAPMAQYSAVDGDLVDWHFAHYAGLALGGAGLLVSEMTCPAPDARITTACAGLWNDAQEESWRRVVEFAHAQSHAKFALQLGHAGRKGSTRTPAEGEDRPLADGNWPLLSASPLPYLEGLSQTPRAMTRGDMDQVIEAFSTAARRGVRAGFDMLELHCAHGYLLASFLSPLTNRRTDSYGGPALARAKFPLELFAALRAILPAEMPISVRISACDWAEGGITPDDVRQIALAFKAEGADIIHASSGQTVPWQKPVYGRMWQTPFAEYIRNVAGIPTIAVGDITLPEQINTIIAAGRADLCALARPHLNNPFFTRQAAGHYGVHAAPGENGWPTQLKSGEYQLFREAAKANERALDLALKARPNRRHYRGATNPT